MQLHHDLASCDWNTTLLVVQGPHSSSVFMFSMTLLFVYSLVSSTNIYYSDLTLLKVLCIGEAHSSLLGKK